MASVTISYPDDHLPGRQEAPDHRPLVTLCRVDRVGVQGLTTPRRVAPPSVCGGNRAFVGLKLCVFLAV